MSKAEKEIAHLEAVKARLEQKLKNPKLKFYEVNQIKLQIMNRETLISNAKKRI
jgi:hypothetical protein